MGFGVVTFATLLAAVAAVLVAVYTTDHWYGEFAHDFLPPIIQRQINPHFKKTSGFTSKNFREVVHKEVRDYWDKKPCNSGWEFPGIKFGTKEYFDKVREKKFIVEPHIPPFAEFERWKGKRVLEIGGGLCTTAVEFARAGAQLTVVDMSPHSMELCKQRFSVYNLTAEFFVGNSEELTEFVPLKKFDLIWSFGVIHHTPWPEKVLAQMKRFAGPDTLFKLMVYTKVSYKLFWVLKETNQWEFAHMDEIVAHYSEAREGSPVTYTYTLNGARAMMTSLGFQVDRLFKDHIFAYDIPTYKQGKFIIAKEFEGVPTERFKELEEELGWHLMIEGTCPECTAA